MLDIFLILFLISLLCLIIGLIWPGVIVWLFKHELSRAKIGLIIAVPTIVFFVLFGITSDGEKAKLLVTNNQITQITTESKTDTKAQENAPVIGLTKSEEKIIEYTVVNELFNKRYDGGRNYYVLIDPIDLTSDSFKSNVKTVIKKIVADKGTKISIEIHDKRSTLDLSFKQYGDMSLDRVLNQNELEERAIHLIADYSGSLETNIYLNTLSFFPGAFKDNPKVGKYLETFELDVKNN